ncbi:MAG: hypothetical protein U5K27_02145 [Desulfotignum sp.]|nr:hypothetical protein [Desulfotignum sp.]
MEQPDIIIIGAGLSGIYAAALLAKKKQSFLAPGSPGPGYAAIRMSGL